MGPVHMSPEEALQAHGDLKASTSVAIHFGTFPLADDGEREPVEKLRAAQRAIGPDADRFWVLGFGEGRDVPAL
jgi:L-ascorbate metabolism protein UlaG (beta-lactamase superfamily)